MAFSADVPGDLDADGILSRPGDADRSDQQVFVLELFKIECSIGAVFLFFDHLPNAPEFEDYFNWVAAQITDIIFAVNVNSVDYDPDTNLFIVQAAPKSTYASKHIVLGYGAEPKSSVETEPKSRVADVSTLLSFNFPDPLHRVLVVGGGQSAAECVNYLLDEYLHAGTTITWATSETAFRALDISNFA